MIIASTAGGFALLLIALTGLTWAAERDGTKPLGWFGSPEALSARRRQFAACGWGLFGAFVLLGLLTELHAVRSLDHHFSGAVYQSGGQGFTSAARRLSASGGRDLMRFWIPLILCGFVLRRAYCLRFFSFAMLGTLGLEILFKGLFHRLRPGTSGGANMDSFPSGHALAATILAGTLLLVLLPACRRPWQRWALGAAAGAWALGMSATRVYLGAHFVTDVVGAMLLGSAWLCLCVAVLTRPEAAGATIRATA
jgi:membrane-associated phospholipid phosphatase